ncbi:MAG: nicotinate phosphoribosyltransferase, partial [Alphaproteobacteria bacterium]|nr:nicotinate phosphoribosyltransferase [Alphaproteobacteria bacterium]
MSQLTTLYNTRNITRGEITEWTDSYFTNTAKCVKADGENTVTYAVFIRTPSMFAPEMVTGWLKEVARHEGFDVVLESPYQPGDIVPAGEPQLYITGPFSKLVECETLFLQKVGAVAVAALNAYKSCKELPDIPFIAMGARHCVGMEMQEMMDYAASVGSQAARDELGAKGFINGASNATAHFFGQEKGAGTMPHALIGYYGSTLKAAQAFRRECPDKPFVVLVDFYGQEITDAIEVARHFPEEAANGTLGFRLDTHGGRYLEGLDHDKSIEVIHKYAPHMMQEEWSEKELKILYGRGVSVANILHFKNEMIKAGFPNVGVLGSSGFNEQKCRMMNLAKAPLTGVGTGSYIPDNFHETYATADVFNYDGNLRIKIGRKYL